MSDATADHSARRQAVRSLAVRGAVAEIEYALNLMTSDARTRASRDLLIAWNAAGLTKARNGHWGLLGLSVEVSGLSEMDALRNWRSVANQKLGEGKF